MSRLKYGGARDAKRGVQVHILLTSLKIWGPLLKYLSLRFSLKFCKVEVTFKSQMLFENGTNQCSKTCFINHKAIL